MKFSIIIPVYNVARYLKRCLESVISQKGKDIEIILVNDGSTDSSLSICNKYKEKDDRIKIINKKNEGLGYARNTGISNSKGEYIIFIDSDDYIDLYYIEKLSKYMKECPNADVYLFGYNEVKNNNRIIEHNNYTNIVMTQKNIKSNLLPRAFGTSINNDDKYSIGPAWSGCYRRNFLMNNKIYFLSEREIISEDIVFSINICLNAKKIIYVNELLYNYCQNSSSLSHSYRKDRFEKSENLYKYMIKLADEKKLGDEVISRIYNNHLSNIFVCLKQEAKRKEKLKKKLKKIGKITNSSVTIQILNNYEISNAPFSKKIILYLINHKNNFMIYLAFKIFR